MQRAAGGMLRKWRVQKEKAAEISAAFLQFRLPNQIFLIFSSILKMDLVEPINRRL
ncbi:MAG: hypothetical protein KAY04_04510 [Burkholderiales bacterium]|nr:hypothetical protein [Burkholderiales bacterium]